MNLELIAKIGNILRWAGILILLGFLIDHFTPLSLPIVGKIKYSAIVIWLLGTVMLRYAQYKLKNSEQ